MDLFDASHSVASGLLAEREHRLRDAASHPGSLIEWAQRQRQGAGRDAKGSPVSLNPGKTNPAVALAGRDGKSAAPRAEFAAERSLEDLSRGLERVTMPTLVLGVQTDILFPCWQQREISDSLKRAGNQSVTYYELDSKFGHDTFLIDVTSVGSAVKGHLEL
ncbi:MAG: hypothetical protein BJ554DRAFT_8146 [Olpidium bornovanus]|uniref:Homoserine O-acetyltransferase n=1 Tax=Olpidium bornovanus TaxID=278681 RepID=A0A8H7ZV66_9FUNG|nr:MAG: hypothetical protein BJ554DRAFT_8146 [Olpidium bornovanus]